MKKMYIAPAVEINETMACQMMALSLLDEAADRDFDVLVNDENEEFNIWADED